LRRRRARGQQYDESGAKPMKKTLIWLIVIAVCLIGFFVYRSWTGSHLNVTPDAQREIEKAKRR
jgi:hypothetical protein